MARDWNPPVELSADEERVLRLCKKQKLWSFFRLHRDLILDETTRKELRDLCPEHGPGSDGVAPEQLALGLLLQVAVGASDQEVPALTALDARWQVVLGCLGAREAAFSQGTVFNFRERVRQSGLLGRMLDRTVAVARETKGFSHRRLRGIFDSSPLVGAGRVEDTFNLLGRALSELVEVAASESAREASDLADELEISVVTASSVKAVLDVDWRKPEARSEALRELIEQFERIQRWLRSEFDAAKLASPPLAEHVATVRRIIEQDTDSDPEPPDVDGSGGEAVKVRNGVPKDRLVSLSDRDMRHGRKSKSKRFNGYKRHVAADADVPGLISSVCMLPANRPERDAAEPMVSALQKKFELTQLQIDRGYLTAPVVVHLRDSGVDVVSKPPAQRNGERFAKSEFKLDFSARTATCPAGQVAPIAPNNMVSFPAQTCHACPIRTSCITDENKRGRQLRLHAQEKWYREMAAELATSEGRAKRRERTTVEHVLARVSAIQGNKARFKGLEKNEFHLQAVAIVNNLYVLDGLIAARQAA